MRRVHYISGIILSIFVGFHLLNHFYSIFGENEHIQLMHDFRVVYRNVVVEKILLSAVAVQIVSGIKLVFEKHKTTSGFFDKLHIWTGLYLAAFLLFHVSVILFGRYYLKLDTNFYFGVAGLNTFPYNLFFIPYYGLAIVSFFGHIASIHSKKMRHAFLGLSPSVQSKAILIFGLCLTIVIFDGLTNHFVGVSIPSEYNILIGK